MSPTWEQNPAVTGLVLPPTTILRNEYANSTGAKGERACILQARVSLRVDEACGQHHGEVFRGERAGDQ